MLAYCVLLVALLTVASLPASAQTAPSGLDVSGAVSFLTGDVTTAITTVGGALIVLAALALGFKWIKAMFFG